MIIKFKYNGEIYTIDLEDTLFTMVVVILFILVFTL
jgi:hypothetical protein